MGRVEGRKRDPLGSDPRRRARIGCATRLVHRWSDGVPRLINIIAYKALLLAYGEGAQQVLPTHVRRAAADTPAAQRRWPWWWLGFAMLLLSAGSIGWAVLS